MVDEHLTIELSMAELRQVTGFAVLCAEPAVALFERVCPGDRRVRDAVDAARGFAEGAARTKAIRDSAWAAQRAYQETRDAAAAGARPGAAAPSGAQAGLAAASAAARAGVAAASAAYLHPLAKATQVLHILGAAAYAAHALELEAGGDAAVGDAAIEEARRLAGPAVVAVLARYPHAPAGRGRAGELVRRLDASLRHP